MAAALKSVVPGVEKLKIRTTRKEDPDAQPEPTSIANV
jgi:hypothetical protein